MKNKKYVCPMHPEVSSDKVIRCSKCGMKLVLESEFSEHSAIHMNVEGSKSYTPLFVMIGLIFLVSLIFSLPEFYLTHFISYFMIGFFLVFSGFKLIDLDGFAEGYSTYDLLAMRFYSYGYIYPFIELFFAISMILNLFPKEILIAEIIVMTFSGIGVGLKLWKKEPFQCACLGTFLKVPLTKITLIEDFGMALLALVLLILM